MKCMLAFTRTNTGFYGRCMGSECAWGSGIADKAHVIQQWEKRHGVTFVPSEHLASAMILYPNSSTNDTKDFHVVRYLDWIAYFNRETRRLPVISAHSSYGDADDMQRAINSGE